MWKCLYVRYKTSISRWNADGFRLPRRQAARGGGQSQTRVGPTKFHHYPYPRESRGSGSFRGLCYLKYWLNRIIILIIIIISIFKEDNVFSMIDSLPYGPPVNTDIDYYQTFFGLFFVSVAILVCAIFVRRRKASACLIMLSTKQGSNWYHWPIQTHDIPIPKRMLYH